LFLTYGRRLLPDLQISEQNWRTLVHLARLTEGSPLALELAAAWVDALPLADIARELEAGLTILARRGADPMARHASMESIFAASLKRLGEADSAVFCKLCVFRGGFTRPAAQAVAGAHLPALLVFIQKSLVRLDQRTGKYYIHELLRQFGVEILKTSGELDVIAQAQFRYFVDRTISLENKLHGPEQADGLGQFDKDQDNLRLALQWGIDHPEAADALVDMVNALTWYWRMRSSVAEACDWLDKINARVHPSPVHQARLHWVSGHHAWMRGAFAQARDHQQAGITLCESLGLGQSVEMGKLMVGLGMTDAEDNRPEEARQSFERALELFRALGDDWWTAFTLGWLALPLHHSNSKQQAHRSISECIQIYRGLGDQWALGLNLDHFATMEYADRRFSQAEELAKEAMIYEDSTGHKHSVGQILLLLGRIAQQREDFARAREYYRQSLEIFLQMGHPYFTQEARQLLSELLE
jgi:tetratricopeptide (TPR) repeat protein